VDLLGFDPVTGTAPKRDRRLVVDLWYPARPAKGAKASVYSGELTSEPPRPPTKFTVAGVAVRDARAEGGAYPLVIVSHGYGNVTAALTWLTENLASKGYVVAAIRHEDPTYGDRAKFPVLLLRRPLDIAFVAQALQATLGAEGLVDAQRTALIGYSMGGYGVLTAAGASLDPQSVTVGFVPGGLLLPYARGGALRPSLQVSGLRAVVALAPYGGGVLGSWGADGIGEIKSPLFLIAGDEDRTVDYKGGARSFFDRATGAERYLLTFHGGGHSIGLGPAPETMRSILWDQDWFEDPVWRKERILGINAHFITAFLDRFVKGDESRAAYLDVKVPEGGAGEWAAPADVPYGAYSPGTGDITLWKGFQRKHAIGLGLLHAAASGPS
jgi:predicted dienelactone hydrolase